SVQHDGAVEGVLPLDLGGIVDERGEVVPLDGLLPALSPEHSRHSRAPRMIAARSAGRSSSSRCRGTRIGRLPGGMSTLAGIHWVGRSRNWRTFTLWGGRPTAARRARLGACLSNRASSAGFARATGPGGGSEGAVEAPSEELERADQALDELALDDPVELAAELHGVRLELPEHVGPARQDVLRRGIGADRVHVARRVLEVLELHLERGDRAPVLELDGLLQRRVVRDVADG